MWILFYFLLIDLLLCIRYSKKGQKDVRDSIRDFYNKVISDKVKLTTQEEPVLKKKLPSESVKVTFSCDKCSNVYSLEKNLNAHKKTKHGKFILKYACNSCQSVFSRSYDLKYHLRCEHGEDWNIREIEKKFVLSGKPIESCK